MITNFELKLKARAALKDNWQIALMVGLIASLPSLIGQVVQILSQNSAAQALNAMLASGGQLTLGDLANSMQLTWSSMAPVLLINLVAALITPCLSLGWLNYTIKLLRRDEDAVIATVFSRVNRFFKAIGLSLMIALRTFLWGLPGTVLTTIALVLEIYAGQGNAISVVLAYAGLIAVLVLVIRATMHYSMAFRFMAETPDMGINCAIRQSVEMMSHRKMQLFMLEVSFMLYSLGISLLESLLLGMGGAVIATTASMVLSFVVNVYLQTTLSAFYLTYRQESTI